MPDKDILYGKIAIIQRCLQRIKEVTGLNPATLENMDKQDIFVLNLQRAVQAALDLAAHIIASSGLGLPKDLKEHFRVLSSHGIISKDLSSQLEHMAGFRNIAIHEYQSIDTGISQQILQFHLKDLEDFYTAVVAYYHLNEDIDGK
jgi:uncharacterized protein YutE (UPF0331/DUF86 family)